MTGRAVSPRDQTLLSPGQLAAGSETNQVSQAFTSSGSMQYMRSSSGDKIQSTVQSLPSSSSYQQHTQKKKSLRWPLCPSAAHSSAKNRTQTAPGSFELISSEVVDRLILVARMIAAETCRMRRHQMLPAGPNLAPPRHGPYQLSLACPPETSTATGEACTRQCMLETQGIEFSSAQDNVDMRVLNSPVSPLTCSLGLGLDSAAANKKAQNAIEAPSEDAGKPRMADGTESGDDSSSDPLDSLALRITIAGLHTRQVKLRHMRRKIRCLEDKVM
ncbi:unnamed protein product [Protopolystoma xenopodis]|uniref:Uncharacterized protein n=1 Tax=Protopolystoma xenopodis TaxID=117903 RepID=A0A3S5A6I0_9PLAT|nr:unnamed protein product [Protopolystoma xenopodis]